jgi:hypothetical protein
LQEASQHHLVQQQQQQQAAQGGCWAAGAGGAPDVSAASGAVAAQGAFLPSSFVRFGASSSAAAGRDSYPMAHAQAAGNEGHQLLL